MTDAVADSGQGLAESALPFTGPRPGSPEPSLTDAAALAALLRPAVGMGGAMVLAERLLARFGSLAALTGAKAAQLGLEPDLPRPARHLLLACGPFVEALLQERLPRRDLLRHPDELRRFLAAGRRLHVSPGMRALLLDAAGGPLADLPLADAADPAAAETAKALLRLACAYEPAAIVLVRVTQRDPAGFAPDELASVDGLARMLAPLAVALADYVLVGPETILSARERRLL
jgi:DNA repair protein RadC